VFLPQCANRRARYNYVAIHEKNASTKLAFFHFHDFYLINGFTR
jgi:hypothetical protein